MMNVSSRTIAKNTSVLMASQLITWGFTFLLSILMPRYLGPTGIGQLQLAASLWSIVGVVAALGTDLLITKEIAAKPGQLNELVGTAFTLRALLFVAGAFVILIYILLVGYSPQTAIVILIVGVSFFIIQLTGTYDAALKGLERMEFIALAAVISIMLLSFMRIGLLLSGYGVIIIAAVSIITSLVSLVIQFFFLRKDYKLRLSINWQLMRPLIKASLPFFMVYAGIVLYHQVDTVIISLLVNEATIGWYGSANQLYGSLLFIPNVFVTALFPALTRTQKENPAASQMLAKKSLNLLLLVSLPVGWGMTVIANQLVVLLFGEPFTNSGPVLAIRGIFLFLTYTNMLLGFLLISLDRQKAWAYVILIATFATIPLDLILVPWTVRMFANGAMGGALSFAFTEIGQTAAGLALLPQGYFSRANAKPVIKLLLAGLVMVAVTWFFRDAFLIIPVIVGAVTYGGMIFLLKPIPKDDWDFILGIARSAFQRVRGRLFKNAQLGG